jgi:ammonia channel protein AmtB
MSGKSKIFREFKMKTYYVNPMTNIDLFTICRGIIAGSVSVASGAPSYKNWTSIVTGAFGGFIYIWGC